MNFSRIVSCAFACVLAGSASLCAAQAPPPMPPPSGAAPPSRAAPPPAAAAVRSSVPGAEAQESAAPPSRWQADLDRLDADLRLRLLTAKDPQTDWLAGELDTGDTESQVRHFAAARTAAPNDKLYLASLGVACMTPARPPVAACDAVDRLADWARRDDDNGVPALLLADRARRRSEPDLAASFVEQAAAAPRFDDYWSQSAQRWWEYLNPLGIDVDPAAKARAAANYASARELAWVAPLRSLCAEPARGVARMRDACAKVGLAMMTRGASFALRRAGARIAEINAADQPARKAAETRHARILEMTARCTQLQPDFTTALESPQGSVRTRGLTEFGAWASTQAREGEVGACERMLAATPRR